MTENLMDRRYPTCHNCEHEENGDPGDAVQDGYIEVKCSRCGKEYHAEVHLAYDCIVR